MGEGLIEKGSYLNILPRVEGFVREGGLFERGALKRGGLLERGLIGKGA